MKKKILILIMTFTATGWMTAAADTMQPRQLTMLADTTYLGEDDDEEEGDTIQRTRKNIATGYNAMKYILENRYIPAGETFTKKWYDHLFIEAGVGAEQMHPPSEDYKFNTLTMYHLGIGKQLNKLNTLRLRFHGALGYQQSKDLTFSKYGIKAEHLYDLSAYFSGYNPTRLFNLSSILGFGAQMSQLETKKSGTSFEGHIGAQLRFFTGPQAYLNVEPYIGLASDQMDLSENRNWRKTDIFYGINLNFIYYLRNNLSPESHQRFIQNRRALNFMSTDSILESWTQPWFVQFSNGFALQKSPRLPLSETMGSEITLTVGRWLSPVIGLRVSGSSRSTIWNKEVTPAYQYSYRPEYIENLHNVYVSTRLEALVNPLGFNKNYDWDARFGFFFSCGAEMGWLLKTQRDELSCRSEAYSGGINFWYRLGTGLKVFFEPRYEHVVYKIPYTNVNWSKQYADNFYTFNIGIAIETRDNRRFLTHKYEYEYVVDLQRRWTIGIGGGTNLIQVERSYVSGNGLGYNGQIFGEYHFNRTSAVRLSAEYLSLSRSNLTDYIDYNMDYDGVYPEENNAPVARRGLWDHHYTLIFANLGYMANISQLFHNYRPERFRLQAFAGPTAIFTLKHDATLSPEERLMLNHRGEMADANKNRLSFGGHLGLKLEYRFTPKWAIHFTPTTYFLGSGERPGINFIKVKFIETFNLGVQYSF